METNNGKREQNLMPNASCELCTHGPGLNTLTGGTTRVDSLTAILTFPQSKC